MPSPCDVQRIDQAINGPSGIVARDGGQVGVSGCGQDADMAKDLLQLKQINPGLQHMGGIAVTQGVA